jgi:hypothetical protein
VVLHFNLGTGDKSGFGFKRWPRRFRLQVKDGLPAGWSWALEGVDAERPFPLRLGEIRPVDLHVQVARDAPPHSGGSIEVRQVDVATGRIVGGVEFTLYEDHRPPRPVDKLKAAVVNRTVVLTWDPVLSEVETGMRDRVAYYEILRDGKPVAKALRDGDRFQPGMQWTDSDTKGGKRTYAVRVVDEGDNVSKPSPEVTVAVPPAT